MPLKKKARTLRVPKKNAKDLAEVTTPKTTPLTPLGTLSLLPRELRDEIYSDLLPLNFRFNSWPKFPHKKWLDGHVPAHRLSMSAVSKHIRQEFLVVVYAEAVFMIEECLSGRYVLARHDIPFIDHIQNLELRIVLGTSCCWNCRIYETAWDDNLPKKKAVPTMLFTGTRILRNTCVIEVKSCTEKRLALLLRSHFFYVIKQLKNFKSVTLQLVSENKRWVPIDVTDLGSKLDWGDQAVAFRVVVDAISNALEPSLGPSVFSGTRSSLTNAWYITFRPRDYLTQKKSLEHQLGAQVEGQGDNLTVIEDEHSDRWALERSSAKEGSFGDIQD